MFTGLSGLSGYCAWRGLSNQLNEPNKLNKSNKLRSDLKKEAGEIPGVKEVRAIKETAYKVRNFAKILK